MNIKILIENWWCTIKFFNLNKLKSNLNNCKKIIFFDDRLFEKISLFEFKLNLNLNICKKIIFSDDRLFEKNS